MTRDSQIRDYWGSPQSGKVESWLARDREWSPLDPAWSTRPDVNFVREFLAPISRGRSVLDLGAGTGRWVHLWCEHGARLTSLEWSEAFFPHLEARSRALGARCERVDLTTAHLDEQFDLVFGAMFLMHIHPARIRDALVHIDAMAGEHLCFTTWLDPAGFDHPSTSKVQSFSHDCDSLFAERGWQVLLKLGLNYGNAEAKGESSLVFLRKRG